METALASYVSAETEKRIRSKSIYPHSDPERAITGKSVSENWATSALKLSWTSSDELNNLAQQMHEHLNLGSSRYSERSQEAGAKNIQRKEITKRGSRLKSYLTGLHDTHVARLMFAEFGFIHEKKKYTFRTTESGFVQSILECMKACEKYQILSPEFGKPYWEIVYNSFSSHVLNTRSATGDINESKMAKEDVRNRMDRIFRAVALLIQAENPDNYKDVMRQWGYRKS